jgi:hypothetical protein
VGLRLVDLWEELAPPLGCTLAMISVVMLTGRALSSVDAHYRLGVCVLLGILVYVVAALSFNRARIFEVMTMALSLRRKREPR